MTCSTRKQNIDAGVKHLKWLLERYNGNLDWPWQRTMLERGPLTGLTASPHFRETRDYVQKVQNAYFRPGSGRLADAFINRHAIHKDVTPDGRVVFTNE